MMKGNNRGKNISVEDRNPARTNKTKETRREKRNKEKSVTVTKERKIADLSHH